MKTRPAACIIERGHVLLMQYHYGSTDVFNLPGGNPDPGETLSNTLVRELYEELTIDVEIGTLLAIGEVSLPQQKTDVLHVIFEAHIIGGIPRLNPTETSALSVVWIPLAQLHTLAMYPHIGEALQDLILSQQQGKYLGRIPQQWYE